jgi:hypothetical protein
MILLDCELADEDDYCYKLNLIGCWISNDYDRL